MSCTYRANLSPWTLKGALMTSSNTNIYKADVCVRSDESKLVCHHRKPLIRKWMNVLAFAKTGQSSMLHKRIFIFIVKVFLFVETFSL